MVVETSSPAEFEVNLNYFKEYVKKYKNIQLLNTNISNSELIKEKIDCVTTYMVQRNSMSFHYLIFL